MADPSKWLIIRVELVSGRGEVFSPRPGRLLYVPPGLPFGQLGTAIDRAFSRWDLDHFCTFTTSDGVRVCDAKTLEQFTAPDAQQTARTLDTPIRKHFKPGAVVEYVFDLTDEWRHVCRGDGYTWPPPTQDGIDGRPLVVMGWGTLPDQHGKTSYGEEIDYTPPTAPARRSHPVDRRVVMAAAGTGSPAQLLDHLQDADVTPALQHIGGALLALLEQGHDVRDRIDTVLLQLRERSCTGDDVLADELRAALSGQDRAGTPVPVDLGELTDVPSIDGVTGAYLNSSTGEVYPAALLQDGADEFDIDLEDPVWIFIDDVAKTNWYDMADFISTLDDSGIAAELSRAIEGKGAFSRFRRTVHELGLMPQWQLFDGDRRLGQTRELLAGLGLRPVPRRL